MEESDRGITGISKDKVSSRHICITKSFFDISKSKIFLNLELFAPLVKLSHKDYLYIAVACYAIVVDESKFPESGI